MLENNGNNAVGLEFVRKTITAEIIVPDGRTTTKPVEIRYDPLSGRSCRITYARAATEGCVSLPPPPPEASDTTGCPFCHPALTRRTPTLPAGTFSAPRLQCGAAILFPNLFPYGRYSAVSIINERHFVEIGTATPVSYGDCLRNCAAYLKEIGMRDSAAVYMAVTQNHLPAAGGSLLHPHLQVHADRIASNYHRFLEKRAAAYHAATGRMLLSDYLAAEASDASRLLGKTGCWYWLTAFAPEGFYEIWAIRPGLCSMLSLSDQEWMELADGIIRVQKFYRSLGHNAYNFGLLTIERPESRLELRFRMVVRSDYREWSRNDYTGFEIMLGEMATFRSPEEIAVQARNFWLAEIPNSS